MSALPADPFFEGHFDAVTDDSALVAMQRRLHAFARTLRARGYDVAWGKPSSRGNEGYLWVLSYQHVEGGDVLDVRIPCAAAIVFTSGAKTVPVVSVRARTDDEWAYARTVEQIDAALVSILRDRAWRRFLESARLLGGG